MRRRVAHGRDARDVLTHFFSTASATRGEHDECERSHRHHRAGAPNPVSVQLDLRIHNRGATPTLAIAGSLARKKLVPAGLGTLPTHTPLFVAMLISIVIIVGALTFIPALALGPIVEHLLMVGI